MASIIRIKRSNNSGNPATLGTGELAYSNKEATGEFAGSGDRLYIGMGVETAGNAANHIVIGGKYFTDKLDHTPGTLTANSAIITDSDNRINNLKVDNLDFNGNTISSTNTDGNIVLTPDGDGYVTISGTNALVIPKGTSLQQAPNVSGAIRFNTTNTSFEGYDGTNWSSLGGVRSIDQNTYVTALNTGDIKFYSDSTNVVTVNGDGIDIKTTTATTSDGTTGALKVAGGASIQGNLFVGGNLYGIDEVSSSAYLAANGNPTGTGTTGYSFADDTGYDTGMFSVSDGILSLYTNNEEILKLSGTTSATLNADTLLFGSGGNSNEGVAAQLAWNGGTDAIKFDTWGYPNNAIRATPVTQGQGFLIQSSNSAGDANAGRSSLRWHDYDVSRYSQVDAQYDGVWIKNAQWTGSSVAQYWKFALDGKIGFPDINTADSGVSDAQFWAENNNAFVLKPSGNLNALLHFSNWDNSDRFNIWNGSDGGLTLGNYDNGESYIDIGGPDAGYYDSANDIALYARNNGKIYLRTDNNDIVLKNDSGEVTFRNSDGHLVIPGVVETNDATGDVILAASNGTEKNAVFTGAGWLTLPDVGFQWYDSNNISGDKVAEMGFDGELYINNFNNAITLFANNNARWSFTNTNGGTLELPHGAILSDGSSNSILLGNGVDATGYSQRISIGYQPTTQDGQSWDTISIGARAGTTNQGNNAIAMGNRAGNSGQGSDAIAIGSSPNSSVGGAGYLNQGSYAVAIGAQAGESNQQSSAVAIGAGSGNTSQGTNAVAIGVNAGNTSQQQNAVAIGNNAGYLNQQLTAIAIGEDAGNTNQNFSAIAIGRWAGDQYQGQKAVAIGRLAGRYGQGDYAVAIGHHAGQGVFDTTSQGTNAIAIGSHAAEYSQHNNSIVIQATATGDGTGINPDEAGLFIDPIRNVNAGSQFVIYNSDTKEVTYNATNIEIDGAVITATNAGTDANVILEPIGAGYVSASNAQIKNVAEPTDDTDAATKYYVDAARSGLDVKQSVRLATTVDIALTGVKTIDTKTTVTGDRILVKNQDTASENGIYIANDSGAWTRATDFDQNTEVTSGAFTFVEDGSVNLNAGFVVTTKVVDVGVTAIDWTLFSSSGTLIAGDGLVKSGYTLAVNVNNTTGGIEISDDALQLKSSLAGDGLTYANGVLTVGGTTDRITVNTHTVDIASTYVGQNTITTLGTITTGIWQGTAIADTYVANDLTISGGTVDNTPIGSTTRAAGAFTTLAANNLVTFTDTTEAGPLGTGSVVMSGGLSVAKKIYVGGNLTGAGADTSVLSGFDIDGGTY